MPTIPLRLSGPEYAKFHSEKLRSQADMDTQLTNEQFVIAMVSERQARYAGRKP